jgi:hypothetical protein
VSVTRWAACPGRTSWPEMGPVLVQLDNEPSARARPRKRNVVAHMGGSLAHAQQGTAALGQVASQTRYLAPWQPEAYAGIR